MFAIAIAIQSYRLSFPLAQTIFTVHIHGFAGFSRSVLVAISLSPTVVLSTSLFPSLHPKATKYKNEKKTVCLWVKRFFIDFSSVFSMFSSQTFKYQTISYSFGTKKCWCFSHLNEYAWCLYVWSLHELFFFLWACNHMRTAGNIHHFISSFR